MVDLPLSVLELALVEEGQTAAEALAATIELAPRVERMGYRRFWVAEHHRMPSVASVAPVVLIGEVAARTSTISVGSGGIMLPNHSALAVAEHFATLDALHPGRIDLGFGRGPGTFDADVVRELRRGAPPATADDYERDAEALLAHLGDTVLPAHESTPEPWMLSSSTSGAQLAGRLGLPIALAHHLRPMNTLDAAAAYRSAFRPSRWADTPRVLVCAQAICAETDDQAEELAGPVLAHIRDLVAGRQTTFPPPDSAAVRALTAEDRATVRDRVQLFGSPRTVHRQLAELAASTAADEIMLTTPICDLAARTRSFELIAEFRAATSQPPSGSGARCSAGPSTRGTSRATR